jgi:hypothetical protein
MNSRRIGAAFGAAIALTLASSVSPSWAVYESTCPLPCVSPPKERVFVRETSGTIQPGDTTGYLVGFLAKGKTKRVLRIDATVNVSTGVGGAGVMDVNVSVNGVTIEGGALFGFDNAVTCQAQEFCAFTGTYWLDLDAAEAANPGTFINQPLGIVLQASSPGNTGRPFGASFSAELEKKK